jgi:hypothetical protein
MSVERKIGENKKEKKKELRQNYWKKHTLYRKMKVYVFIGRTVPI